MKAYGAVIKHSFLCPIIFFMLYHKKLIKEMVKIRNHVFSQVPKANIPRSKFPSDHEVKTTFDSGYLVPILVYEVLPADSINCRVSLFARLATLISPIMDNMFMDTFFFFVPERLVFGHFQNMLGEQDNPDDSTDYLFPTITAPEGGFEVGSLADYFGIPTGVGGLEVRAEPFRCYNLIFNEWFRDQNLQDSVPFTKADSGDDVDDYKLLRRCKAHSYITSCLPWPQKGPGVDLPLGGSAPITVANSASINGDITIDNPYIGYYTASSDPEYISQRLRIFSPVNAGDFQQFKPLAIEAEGLSSGPHFAKDITSTNVTIPVDSLNGLSVDLSQAGAVTINAMREAFQVQRWYEALARGGSRYTEVLLNFFGVQSPDARLQRPEYLGGGSSIIQVNVVPQTSASDAVTPQANLSAYAVGVNHKGDGFTKSFVEHGWIIGLVNVRAKLTFQQGLNRMWSRSTKFDLYWPQFAHLGEQAVLNKEVYAQGTDDDDGVFGYQERYAEYRYYPSLVTGKFRSSYAQSLDSWHLALYYDSLPQLNDEFIQDTPPVDRVVAVQDEPQVLLDAFFKMDCVRAMPLYSVPGLIDHF